MAEIEVRDVPAADRFEVHVDGKLAGFAVYRRAPGLIDFLHTEVDPEFGGQGVGSALVREALAAAADEDLAVIPHCPFVRAYLQRHPELVALVPEDRRAQFGL
ncbi:N-acetyltransferase [Solirubrobacter phytolaccae]|uniref:N-acetyltransferase n=1 Tax=Solirubrobacter phytolaccae TaxID=1404360 RepID=A0A9X3NFG4_9ACTN|nr:GNAT family N-acetyltransferase [Solirubrobacter phytolaccae]MDA0184012.1 N-acetyltransferase [Solirubrobacter phytolaccae]